MGLHRNTIEVTKDDEISRRADCIIGVKATKACSDLSFAIKEHIQRGGRICVQIIVGDERFSFQGRGSSRLDLLDDREIVLRRSEFASSRTGAMLCDAAAKDIPRSIIGRLRKPETVGLLKISIL